MKISYDFIYRLRIINNFVQETDSEFYSLARFQVFQKFVACWNEK